MLKCISLDKIGDILSLQIHKLLFRKRGSHKPLYSRDIIEQVLNSTDIVQVVSSYCELKESGTDRYKALCPFHAEKTPSFFVSKSRQIFHCFGCGKGGDVITFLQEINGLSFNEALEMLAEKAGINLPKLNNTSSNLRTSQGDSKKQLYNLYDQAMSFYRNQLNNTLAGKIAQDYLKKRQISPQIQHEFGLGYAPSSGESLYTFLKSQGLSDSLIIRSGLVRESYNEKRYYDFFRNRIIFPIRSIDGKVVSFGGREITGKDEPKYINLPETELYKKSRILYGLWEGKESIREKKQAILVEGYLDLLRCFQCGIKNVVASCGTALTLEQANLIRRFAQEVVIVYDADLAGINAALRATGILLQAGLSVKGVVLPEGKDPDEFLLSHSIDEWNSLIEKAPTFFSFYIQQNRERLKDPRGKINILSDLFRLISMVEENSLKEEYLREIAHELKISYWAVFSDYELFLKNSFKIKQEGIVEEKKEISIDDAYFIMGLINQPELREKAKLFFEDYPFPQGTLGKVISYILENEKIDPRLIEDPEVAGVITKVLLGNFEHDNLQQVVEDRLRKIEMDYLEGEINQIIREIREAERNQDKEKLLSLLEKQETLINKRNKLITQKI